MQHYISWIQMIIEFLRSDECRIWLRLLRRPAMVVAALFMMVAVGAWLDVKIAAHVARAETSEIREISEIQALACPPGTEPLGNRCYPPCQPGDTPSATAPECLKPCPSASILFLSGFGYRPIAGTNQCQFEPVSYLGKIFSRVDMGLRIQNGCYTTEERQGVLCYPKCRAGFYSAGPICWQRCEAGYVDDGAFCRRPFPLNIYAKQSHPRGDATTLKHCVQFDCYKPCSSGFTTLSSLCIETCLPFYRFDLACLSTQPLRTREAYTRGDGIPFNAIPEAKDTTVPTQRNTPVTFQTLAVDNDTLDAANLQFTLGSFRNGTHNKINGNLVYTPNPGFEGVDTMRWTAFDGKHHSNVAIVTILVGNVPANSAPVALDRTVAVNEDTPITLLVTCTDAENDELFYQLLDKPQHGTYEWVPPNTVIYTPTLNFVGTDSFTFQSHDGQESSNVSTITLTVGATNDAPLAEAQTITTTRNRSAIVNLFATDVESDTLTFTLVTSPTHGTVSGEIPSLLYTPQLHFVGADSFQFQATDAHGAASVATIQITVLPTNTAPLAESLLLTTEQESTLGVNLFASDADGDALAYSLVTSPTQGTVSGEGAELLYTPNAGFIGTDSFTFQANDGQADSPMTTVTIHVTPAPAVASVVGLIYEDRNGNGQPDGEDVGAPGLLVTLTPTDGRADNAFSTTTEAGGGWRIDNVPFGQYAVKVTAGNGVQIEQPIETPLTIGQRGLQQTQPSAVKVTSRALFLPLIQR